MYRESFGGSTLIFVLLVYTLYGATALPVESEPAHVRAETHPDPMVRLMQEQSTATKESDEVIIPSTIDQRAQIGEVEDLDVNSMVQAGSQSNHRQSMGCKPYWTYGYRDEDARNGKCKLGEAKGLSGRDTCVLAACKRGGATWGHANVNGRYHTGKWNWAKEGGWRITGYCTCPHRPPTSPPLKALAPSKNLEIGKPGDSLYFKAKGNVENGKMTMDAAMEIGTPKALTDFAGNSEFRFQANLLSEVDACAPAGAQLSMKGSLTIKVNPDTRCSRGNAVDCTYEALKKVNKDWRAKMKNELCKDFQTVWDICSYVEIPFIAKKTSGIKIELSEVVDTVSGEMLKMMGTDLTFWIQDEKAESGGVTFTIKAQMHVLDSSKMGLPVVFTALLPANFAVIRTEKENIGKLFKDLHDNAGIGGDTASIIDESGRITIPYTCSGVQPSGR